jgi:hypothetical protein
LPFEPPDVSAAAIASRESDDFMRPSALPAAAVTRKSVSFAAFRICATMTTLSIAPRSSAAAARTTGFSLRANSRNVWIASSSCGVSLRFFLPLPNVVGSASAFASFGRMESSSAIRSSSHWPRVSAISFSISSASLSYFAPFALSAAAAFSRSFSIFISSAQVFSSSSRSLKYFPT